jgi:hypothetical protein
MLRTRLRSLLTALFLALTFAVGLAVGPAPAATGARGTAAAATPDFTVTVSPLSQTRKRGTGAPYFVTINCLNGFNSAVRLSLTGNVPPNGVVSIGNPSGCGDLNDGDVDIEILKHTTTTGTFAMTIHASSGGIEHDVNISLTIR